LYLKSLELQGFKSFPDKVKLEFGKGLTAVVGPNGSGKSNIGDAVRWVLGEQSTKTLRGGKMEDIIFSGTQLRKSVGFAQVTLNIDNYERRLLVDNDLVSVSRKLYRSGESDYLINGKNVRLKDVVELFMDTGLGRDGYSIIGQGKVAEIVSSKSNERREIFEEAAGISKFRYKKEEAERRLSSAQDNILRLRDIISELEARVEPLKIQSEKANKFIKFSEEKKDLEISVWIKKLDELKVSLNGVEDKFLISNGEYENLENDLETIEKSVETAYQDMQKSSMKVEELRGEILKNERANSQIFADVAVLENDIVHLNITISQTLKNQEQSKFSSEQANSLINEQKICLKSFENSEIKTKSEISLIEADFDKIITKANEFDKTVSTKNTELNSLFMKKSELNFLIKSTENSLAETKISLEQAISSQEEIDSSIATYCEEKKELESTFSAIEEQLSEHFNKLNGYSKLLERKNSVLESGKSEFSQTDMKIRELTQKSSLLTDLENSMEGFAYSVKEVIKAGKTGQISGVKGSVAQLISVDSKFSLAIETALAGALQNVIVENEDTAKRCISLLKEKNAGRATFLPMTSVKGYIISENNLDMQEGYVAIASELVKFDEAYSGIIRSLLGRVVIAEDVELATAISKKYGYKFKIVTLDGQVINAGGSFTGGSTSRSTGVLTRKNEIETIKNQLAKLSDSHTELKAKIAQGQAEVDKLSIDVEGEKDEINRISSDKVRFETEIKHISANLEQMKIKAIELEKFVQSLDEKIDNQKKLLENSSLQLIICEKDLAEKENEISQTTAEKVSFHSNREELSKKLSSLKLFEVEIKKDKQACVLMLKQLEKSISESESNFDEFEEQIKSTQDEILSKQEQIKLKYSNLENTKAFVENINQIIKQEQKNHQEYERKANEQRNLEKVKNEEKETISREIARIQERKISIQKDYDGIISELWEQYQFSRSEAVAFSKEIGDIILAQKQLNEIKNKIRNLGSVNVEAIDEYKEVSERFEYLSKQLKDVETAKTELEALIENLTENMKELFLESFRQINDNFKTIFVELFGGGKAELTLTEPTNILESGIEINVAPPGKVIKSLSLLSGGEQAFIAIAIYFAILKLKPSPFCILDEIEAALDDVNVAKYAGYLRNFTDTTQFILITHRRGTMEEADVLYGVTMQEKGISKLLKMDNTKNVSIIE